MRNKENKIKSIRVKNANISPMPPFKTLDEESNFWDTHSLVDNIGEETLVGFHIANRNRTLTIRFPEKAIQSLRRNAFRLGIGPTTLARMWLLERLRVTK